MQFLNFLPPPRFQLASMHFMEQLYSTSIDCVTVPDSILYPLERMVSVPSRTPCSFYLDNRLLHQGNFNLPTASDCDPDNRCSPEQQEQQAVIPRISVSLQDKLSVVLLTTIIPPRHQIAIPGTTVDLGHLKACL